MDLISFETFAQTSTSMASNQITSKITNLTTDHMISTQHTFEPNTIRTTKTKSGDQTTQIAIGHPDFVKHDKIYSLIHLLI